MSRTAGVKKFLVLVSSFDDRTVFYSHSRRPSCETVHFEIRRSLEAPIWNAESDDWGSHLLLAPSESSIKAS